MDTFYTVRKFLFKKSADKKKKKERHSDYLKERDAPDFYKRDHPLVDKEPNMLDYNEFKSEYEKSPTAWDYDYVNVFDSTKKYYLYYITQPVNYLLNRKILLSELLIEYILAFFVSIIAGYLFQKIKFQKR